MVRLYDTRCKSKLSPLKGGQNNQTLSQAGAEANLDVQFAFGISYPVAVILFYLSFVFSSVDLLCTPVHVLLDRWKAPIQPR